MPEFISLISNGNVRWALCGVLLVLAGCVSPPFSSKGVATDLSPNSTLEAGADEVGTQVMWAGVIVSSTNVEDGSQLELLTYPLDYLQRPDESRRATGRVLVHSPEYLETVDFAARRRATVLGRFAGVVDATVGETSRELPLLDEAQIHLWTAEEYHHSRAFSVGIGISISN